MIPPSASVAVLVDLSGAAPRVLLGRRREDPRDPWSGDLALPGGRPEPTDRDAMDTALRECREESGVEIPRSAVWGGLAPVLAGRITGRPVQVHPFFAVVDGFRPDRASDGEIDEWMAFPLPDLDRPALRTAHVAPDGSAQPAVRTAIGTLWGATLRILERVWTEPLVAGIHRLWLDFDGTLFPASHPLAEAVDRRIVQWLALREGVSWEEAARMRLDLYHRHGNTLQGMMGGPDVDPQAYLDYVFDLPDSVFPRADPALDSILERLALPSRIFTNARADYVRRGLRRLGIENRIGEIDDIVSFDYRTKPDPSVYEDMLSRQGVEPSSIIFCDDRAGNLGINVDV